jgi:hypothetical protein
MIKKARGSGLFCGGAGHVNPKSRLIIEIFLNYGMWSLNN